MGHALKIIGMTTMKFCYFSQRRGSEEKPEL